MPGAFAGACCSFSRGEPVSEYFIGLSTTLHDPAVAIVDEAGRLLFAEATERYLQNKRAINCEPDHIFRIGELINSYCPSGRTFHIARTWSKRNSGLPWWLPPLQLAGLDPRAFHRPGLRALSRTLLLRQYQVAHLWLCSLSCHLKGGANLVKFLTDEFPDCRVRLLNFNHHYTHAANACFGSPFTRAVCAVFDGYGEPGNTSYFDYHDRDLKLLAHRKGPESLGALYMLLTELCGFSSLRGEEWKVMGLAAHGEYNPELDAMLRSLVTVRGLALQYAPRDMLFKTIGALRGWQRPHGSDPMQSADLANTGQRFFCDLVIGLLRNLARASKTENLILSGGCALNSACAGQILERTPFRNVYIPCAPADDGNAVGAAWLAYKQRRPLPANTGYTTPYLGSGIPTADLERYCRFSRQRVRLSNALAMEVAEQLAQGRIVGWVQGRAEFGARALGNRSILADPRPAGIRHRLNQTVKFRESFRPFAPAILHEFGPAYFENYQESPYMERALRFRADVLDKIPAVVHADGTGRLQTVKESWNPKFYQLIKSFHRLTGIPLLLNTSFNRMGKPIIHSLEDALSVFYTSGLDLLVIEDYIIEK